MLFTVRRNHFFHSLCREIRNLYPFFLIYFVFFLLPLRRRQHILCSIILFLCLFSSVASYSFPSLSSSLSNNVFSLFSSMLVLLFLSYNLVFSLSALLFSCLSLLLLILLPFSPFFVLLLLFFLLHALDNRTIPIHN